MAFEADENEIGLIGRIYPRWSETFALKTTKSGKKFVNFSVSCHRPAYTAKAATEMKTQYDYVPCTAWGAIAETIVAKARKGGRVRVKGSWMSGSYVGKDGKRTFTSECSVGKILFLDTTEGEDLRKNETISDPVADILGVSDSGAGSYPEIDPDDLPF